MIAYVGPFHQLIPRRSFKAGLKVVNDFIEPIIERALRLDQAELEEKTQSSQGYTFLHALASFTRDRKVLRDQIVAGKVALYSLPSRWVTHKENSSFGRKRYNSSNTFVHLSGAVHAAQYCSQDSTGDP